MAAARKSTRRKARVRKKVRKKKPAKSKAPRRVKASRSRKQAPLGEKDPGGAPAIDWDEETAETVKTLATFHNTVEDMATVLGVSKASLEAAIADEELPIRAAYYGGIADYRKNLRAAQTRTALEGNASMLKWLGIQDLGQRDVKAIELAGADGGAVQVEADLSGVLERKLTEFLRSRGKK